LYTKEENYKKQWVESMTLSWHRTEDDKVMSMAMTQQSKSICKMADSGMPQPAKLRSNI